MSDSLDLLNKLIVSNVLLDTKMAELKAKISGKRDEMDRLENDIRREQSELGWIEQEHTEVKSRESRLAKTIQGLQQTNSMLSNLKSTLERGIVSAQDVFRRVVSDRNKILDEYRRMSETYQTAYESLKPSRAVYTKRAEQSTLKALVKKSRYDLLEYKAKVAKLKTISVLRLNKSLVEFAKLMVERKILYRPKMMDDLHDELATLAKTGVTLTVKKVPVKTTLPSSTPIKQRLGVKSVFTLSNICKEAGFREEFVPQASSSQNPLEFNFPPGTSITIVSPTGDGTSTINSSSKRSPFFQL